ncbi:hypothetical protein [Pedobacter panaciterrae]
MEFNQENLKVENLENGNYDLMIDGKKIRTFSADAFAKGINMALLSNTPQYQQAVSIMYLNDLRLELEKKLGSTIGCILTISKHKICYLMIRSRHLIK